MAGKADMAAIKRRRNSILSIEHITNAMRLVSAAKLRRARSRFEELHSHLRLTMDIMEEVFEEVAVALMDSHIKIKPYVKRYIKSTKPRLKRPCFIVVASNRGLAGSFNQGIIKEVNSIVKRNKKRYEEVFIYTIGSRAFDYFNKKSYTMLGSYVESPENVTEEDVSNILEPILQKYRDNEIDQIIVVSTNFVSPIEHQASYTRVLPYVYKSREALEDESEADVVFKSDKYHYRKRGMVSTEVEYEPSREALIDFLIPKYVRAILFVSILQSATCEHAARRLAMQNATDNAKQMTDDLNLIYNRARQAAITSEITEIVSGADALK